MDTIKTFINYVRSLSVKKKVLFVIIVSLLATFISVSCTSFRHFSYDRDSDGNVHFNKTDSIIVR
ncbi:hypothetical protein [Peromfec virus RodF8_12]|uniref:Uncharacterized protein n=1 Tax=Peromfec virus RodF8_12 TaxID=2929358 RepID=A0A976R7S2_9VIRU|nr:hypothetical protein [Peromfec virus RodF8_12]